MDAGEWDLKVLFFRASLYFDLPACLAGVSKKRGARTKAAKMTNQELTINVRLFATLAAHMPKEAAQYPIQRGITVTHLLEQLGVPAADAKLIFIDSVKGGLDSRLYGGERVGIFPPVGGG
jgi:sulfur-carrier protein